MAKVYFIEHIKHDLLKHGLQAVARPEKMRKEVQSGAYSETLFRLSENFLIY